MPGGKGNIKGSDNINPFKEGNNAAEKWSEADALMLAKDMIDWMREEEENVFFDEFIYLACDRSKYKGEIYATLPAYLCKKFTSFSKLFEVCKEIEKTKLRRGGAFNKLNPQIVKFLLSAEYGLSEKQNVDHTTNGKEINIAPITWANGSNEQ